MRIPHLFIVFIFFASILSIGFFLPMIIDFMTGTSQPAPDHARAAISAADKASEVSDMSMSLLEELKIELANMRKEYYQDVNGTIFRIDAFTSALPVGIKSLMIDYRKQKCQPLTLHEIEEILSEYTGNPEWIGFRTQKERALTQEEFDKMLDVKSLPFYT